MLSRFKEIMMDGLTALAEMFAAAPDSFIDLMVWIFEACLGFFNGDDN